MARRRRATIRFAPDLTPAQEDAIRTTISADADEADRFAGYRRSVKDFFRVASPAGELFVKVRRFPTWFKRLRNTARRTKDEREFDHLVTLRRLGVPCPAPLAVARIRSGLLVAETRLVMEFVADAAPLSRALLEQTFPRDVLLDRLVDFLRLLNERGIVHRDLHWDNLLVRPADPGPDFLLVDPLHVRFVAPPAGEAFVPCLQWLLAYMLYRDAPRDLVDALADRLPALDLPALPDRATLLDRARRTADLLR